MSLSSANSKPPTSRVSSIACGLACRDGWNSHSRSAGGAALAQRCASERSSASPAAVTTRACAAARPGATSQTRPGWIAATAGASHSSSPSASPAATSESRFGRVSCHHVQNPAMASSGPPASSSASLRPNSRMVEYFQTGGLVAHSSTDSTLERPWDCVCLPPCRAASTQPWPPLGSPRPVTTSLVSTLPCPPTPNPTAREPGAAARSKTRATPGAPPT